MAEPRINELAEELLRRSRERKVPWEAPMGSYPSNAEYYQVVFPDGALRILRVRRVPLPVTGDRSVAYEHELALISDTGRVIDSLKPEQIEPMYEVLSEIFDLAKNYVKSYVRDRGINKALDFLKSR